MNDPHSGKDDIWVYPIAGGQATRVTFGGNNWGAWSPDGKEIAYSAADDYGKVSIRRRYLDGRQPEEILYRSEEYLAGAPLDWSPDGKYLSLDLFTKEGTQALWILPLSGERKLFRPSAISHDTVSTYDGFFSPDSQWIAYFSYETGRPEVYVVPTGSDGAKYQVSTTGGWLPRFSHTNELFFVTMGNRLMEGQIASQSNFSIEFIRPLFQLDFPNFDAPLVDVSADGQRFVVITADRTKSASITLVTNWPAELKK